MSHPQDWTEWARERQQRVEAALGRLLPAAEVEPRRLHAAMRYAVLGGGKRVRALLAYAAGELANAAPAAVDEVAAGLELLHAYSLVHDDLPCMDDDVLRRGKPTCHVEFDEATALLAGDALQALAFEVVLSAPAPAEPARKIASARMFAAAVGAAGMAGGQAIDLGSVGGTLTLSELEAMHRMKTGALIRAAVRMGAACGAPQSAAAEGALDRFAAAVGLAFQVIDDVLDVSSTAGELGKTPGKDAMHHKPTYVTLLGVPAAEARASSLQAEALEALSAFGERGERLAALAAWIVRRRH